MKKIINIHHCTCILSLISCVLCLMSVDLFSQNSLTINGTEITVQKGITITDVSNIDIADINQAKGMLSNSGIINVTGNIRNNTKNELLGTGEFAMKGANNQLMNGNNRIGSLTIDKTKGDVTLNGNLTVTNQLKFVKGILNTSDNYILTLNENAGVYGANNDISGANDLSYVNGPMIKTGSKKFIFPIGKSSSAYPLHPVAFEPANSEITSFKAEYITNLISSPEKKPNIVQAISQSEYWNLNQLSGSSNGYVSLGLRNTDKNLSQCVVLNYNTLNNPGWEIAGNTGVKMLGQNDGIIRSGLITKFTQFTYGTVTDNFKRELQQMQDKKLDMKVYPNPSEGKDINVDIKQK